MKNWLGQDIQVGSVVGRGTKQSSTSVFQVGEVTELHPTELKARVRWMYNSHSVWDENPRTVGPRTVWDRELIGFSASEGRRTTEGNGSFCSVETLFVLSPETLRRAKEMRLLDQEFYVRKHTANEMTKQEWDDRVAELDSLV